MAAEMQIFKAWMQAAAACVCVVEAKAWTQITQSVMCQLVEVDGHREDVF